MSSGRGLARLDPHTNLIRNYDASDGLAGNDFNPWNEAYKGPRGEMFFAGVSGLTAFYPDESSRTDNFPQWC